MEIAMEEDQKKARKKGGLITMPFIIANETFEKVANIGLQVNMVVYLMSDYHYEPASAATIMSLWSAVSYFMTIFGALLSDSYLGRFRVTLGPPSSSYFFITTRHIPQPYIILQYHMMNKNQRLYFTSIPRLLGLILLWLTAIIHNAWPPPCNLYLEPCETPSVGQLLFLVSSFLLTAIGAGGIRPCSLAFAADQIDNPENPRNERMMKSFFNWYYVSVVVSIAISVSIIVYIQIKNGWIEGFGITVGLMLFSTVMFFLGSHLYIKPKADTNLCIGLAQVVSAAWKNRHLTLPPKGSGNWYFRNGAKLVEPSDKLSDLDCNGIPMDPWSICTVKQVEELKAMIKVLPIWSTGFLVSTGLNQLTFFVVQAGTMDRHLIFNFEVPETNLAVFTVLSMAIWIAFYDRILIPLLSKLKYSRIRGGLTLKQRMGIGIALTFLAQLVAAEVERRRRNHAISEGLLENPKGVVNMSAWWLVPQLCLIGLAEAFNAIGQIEFYYTQFPKRMSSIAMAFFSVSFGVGSLLAGLIVTIVKDVTQRGGRQSWLASDPNNGHYDKYYGILAILSGVNLLYFFVCSWAYGSTQDIEMWDDEELRMNKTTLM
ncbi:hypothetical protein K1719_000121 [Acacia pycnantha]|nr:hypothetical protein K1719_000121 [Acacia pycnantha]